jgi:hypothetical protein
VFTEFGICAFDIVPQQIKAEDIVVLSADSLRFFLYLYPDDPIFLLYFPQNLFLVLENSTFVLHPYRGI